MAFPAEIDIYITLVDNIDKAKASHHNERAAAIITIEEALGINIVNAKITGEIKPWAGTTTDIPSGWLWCNGDAISRTIYASLFAVIDTQYGVGNGTTTFNLPDLRDKFIVGARQDSSGTAKSNIEGSLLKSGGSLSQPPVTGSGGGNESTNSGSQGSSPSHTHTFVPPYLSTIFMIKT